VHNFVLGGVRRSSLFLSSMATRASAPVLKSAVADFWNTEPCGTRYLSPSFDFDAHAAERYRLEPYIADFAQFSSSAGLRVLEIGVGMGADYSRWLQAGARATGTDLSTESLSRAAERCRRMDLQADLRHGDAENLPFADSTFDVVYSYGVMHHSPDTARCIAEAWRVLKPRGSARIMLYHHPSLTGLMLWLRYGIWRGQSLRRCVYERLESPGTKTFTKNEVLALMEKFENVSVHQVFSPGDLLLHTPSSRFQGRAYKLLWKLFPRQIIRLLGKPLGLFLLITATKPHSPSE
jgi:ubiquinone/menaquinone biosynthesis C-methylase UbiE